MDKRSKDKVRRLFQFLKQYNNIKNPIITEINNQQWKLKLDNVPEHPAAISNIYISYKADREEILRVKRPMLKECPKIPTELIPWVEADWQQVQRPIIVKNERKVMKKASNESLFDRNIYEYEKFEDNKERVFLFESWQSERNQWLMEEQPARAVDDLFNSLYELYSNIKKEPGAYELIVGDGNILYKGDVFVDHPILLQHVKLEFNPDVPEFILKFSDKGTELYRGLLYSLNKVNNELLKDIYDDFAENSYSPLEIETTNSFLNRLVNALSSKGRFYHLKELTGYPSEHPQIYRTPYLFLRKTNLGFGVAIDTILEDLNEDLAIPNFLEEVVGCIEEDDYIRNPELLELNQKGIEEDILLTKAANSEQLLVAKYFESNNAVLVQGPPGTGKTHTIANLIGHLLSQGKSILVTSCSEKALSVLKDKVDVNLQSLCLSLLSTTESRAELEKNLDDINEKRSQMNLTTLSQQIEVLSKLRTTQISMMRTFKNKLKNTKLNEYRPIVINGQEFSPIVAAKYISENEEAASWIPRPVKSGVMPYLTEEEIVELYNSNLLLTEYEEREYNSKRPKVEEILNPFEFQKLLEHKSSFSQVLLNKHQECWIKKGTDYSIESLQNLLQDLYETLDKINLEVPWSLEVIEASREEVTKLQWVSLVEVINSVYKMRLDTSDEIIKYNPVIKVLPDKIDIRKQLVSIIHRIETDGKINRFDLLINSDLKTVINACRVNGDVPKYLNEYKAILKYYDLCAARKKLEVRWNRQMAVLGVDSSELMGEQFENICIKYCTLIEERLSWYESFWNPIVASIKALGIPYELLDNNWDLSKEKYSRLIYIKTDLGKRLAEIIDSEIYRLQYTYCIAKVENCINLLREYSAYKSSNIVKRLLQSLLDENIEMYKKDYDALVNIESMTEVMLRRSFLIGELRECAPSWAEEIMKRNSVHGKGSPPSSIKEAWLYAQFIQELDDRKSQSLEEINKSILELENSILETTSELVYKKAWQSKLINFQFDKKQVQAIEGWRQLVRKLGNGKGKRAEIYRAEARKLMPYCQGAIPVWIMPLNKVVENFNPKYNKFDVVIIDEASQADVMALTALYLGKKAIIVGDNEQVSPLSIGEKTEDMDKLIREYLYDIPNDKLYCGKFSLYDLAQASGYQPIRLKEHFRCVPAIIQYSNMLSYNGQIKPLRDDSDVSIKPATIAYKVEGAVCKNKVNEKEAEMIVSLILACCSNEEYKDKTFGVISLRGDKQAALIDRLLQKKLDPCEYERRMLLCGNSANFQGDERDVIFLSMVDANSDDGPLRINGYGTDNLYKKRYNVAVSRAKDQIWLVYSLDSDNDLKPGDIRKVLIEYFKSPSSADNIYNSLSKEAESEFEREVMRLLLHKGYKIIPQWKVGAYRIDMVAIGNNKRVAIECDGERWHGEHKLEEDMIRQSILERLGWKFIRIRGSDFYRNKAQTINDIYSKLQELEIYPWEPQDPNLTVSYGALIERIITAAERYKGR